jgi:predicted phosphodiesterase
MRNSWIAIGDIHGRTIWKDIVEVELHKVDKIIFIGDYFDSFNIPMLDQIKNFSEIVKFARKYPDKVVLLIGNHDYHYLSMGETYSGFNATYALGIEHDYLRPNLDLFKICHTEGEFLFSHAGVTKTWLKHLLVDIAVIDSELDDFWKYKPQVFGWKRNPSKKMSAYTDHYGDNIWQGPLWVRPDSLNADRIKGWTQIVGHTEMGGIKYRDDVYYIDALEAGYYLAFDGEETISKKIEKIN